MRKADFTHLRSHNMNKPLFLAAILLSGATLVLAGNKSQLGTIVSENSVACGSKMEKKMTVAVLCQEYVVRSVTTDYHVRQMKPSDAVIIPINASVEFTLDKDKMKLRVNGKSYEYQVVSEAAAPEPKPLAAATRP
jgi:hypothetical protein